jgi:hypothetical protein
MGSVVLIPSSLAREKEGVVELMPALTLGSSKGILLVHCLQRWRGVEELSSTCPPNMDGPDHIS